MKVCRNEDCEKEIPEQRTYCSPECQRKTFSQSQKGKPWSDEKKRALSEKLKVINSTEEIKEKRRKTNQERYGGSAPACSKQIREQMVLTTIENLGVDNPMKSEEVKEKAKKSMIERYDGFTLQSPSLTEKVKQTTLDRFSVSNISKTDSFKDTVKQVYRARLGVDNPMKSEEVKEKVRQTNLSCFGVTNPKQCFEVRLNSLSKERNLSSTELRDFFTNINSQQWWDQQSSFIDVKIQLKGLLTVAQIYQYAHQFRSDWTFNSFISSPHQKIINLLNQHSIEHVVNDRSLITPKELDIYIPSHSLAIEVNGLYWHSELNGKDKHYHLQKTLECEKKGIRLLQFWDFEMEDKWSIVESMILYGCGITAHKKMARKGIVHPVSNKESFNFFEANHLQGGCRSLKSFGLFFDGELLSCLSLSKPRFNKNFEYEIVRFANKIGYLVNGSFSRLLKPINESIISYADRRYSCGNVYKANGFEVHKISKPSYFYTNNYISISNRLKYQKHKLPGLLETFNPSLTEWDNMVINGFDRVWDCGTISWVR